MSSSSASSNDPKRIILRCFWTTHQGKVTTRRKLQNNKLFFSFLLLKVSQRRNLRSSLEDLSFLLLRARDWFGEDNKTTSFAWLPLFFLYGCPKSFFFPNLSVVTINGWYTTIDNLLQSDVDVNWLMIKSSSTNSWWRKIN